MPPGTPYNSFIPPYPIRVDEFTDLTLTAPTPNHPPPSSTSQTQPTPTIPALYLLTHTHSDHLIGLSSKSFSGTIVCSHDAKTMLLKHETYRSRFVVDNGYGSECLERSKTYAHLKAELWVAVPGGRGGSGEGEDEGGGVKEKRRKKRDRSVRCVESRDLLRAIPLHTPTDFELSNNERVTITLLDANHCPGSVMFLIEGSKGTILHTGDLRAEPHFISSLRRNPFLQQYIAPSLPPPTNSPTASPTPNKTLSAIYLDTASLLTYFTVPSKEEATSALVKLMALYPPETRFYINAWTWGYEDILKAVAHAFSAKIHVDRYKYSVYTSLSDPFLRAIVTRDEPQSTRFHACERFDRCEVVPKTDRAVVYINPMKISTENWKEYYAETKMQIERKEYPSSLLCPLARHSTMPELQEFVGLFKPMRLIPNYLEPSLRGLDWACIPSMLGPYMHPSAGADAIREEMEKVGGLSMLDMLDGEAEVVNVERENMEDGTTSKMTNAQQLARRWGDVPELQDDTKARTVLRKLRAYLPHGLMMIAEHTTKSVKERQYGVYTGFGASNGGNAVKPGPPAYNEDSQEETQEKDNQGMMEWLFGGPTEAYRSPDASPTGKKSQPPKSSPIADMTLSSPTFVAQRLKSRSHRVAPVNKPSSTSASCASVDKRHKSKEAEKAEKKVEIPIVTSDEPLPKGLEQLVPTTPVKGSAPVVDLRRLAAHAKRTSDVSSSSKSKLVSNLVPVLQKHHLLSPFELETKGKSRRVENTGLKGWDKVIREPKRQSAQKEGPTSAYTPVVPVIDRDFPMRELTPPCALDPAARKRKYAEELAALSPERRRVSASLARAVSKRLEEGGGFSIGDLSGWEERLKESQRKKPRLSLDYVGVDVHTTTRLQPLPTSAETSTRTTPVLDAIEVDTIEDKLKHCRNEDADFDFDVFDNQDSDSDVVYTQSEKAIDWERCRMLREAVCDALEQGLSPMLPPLNCLTPGKARE